VDLRRVLLWTIVLAAFGYLIHVGMDPKRTRLPFGTTDLSPVQKQLSRLTPEDRLLVERYVTRSNGDVMPDHMADPDSPFTARTFSEAIKLQKEHLIRMAEQQKVADARQAERDADMAPLRDVALVQVVKRELVQRNDFQRRMEPHYAQQGHRVYSDDDQIFIVTIRVTNQSNDDIVALKGSMMARDRDAYLHMQLCWVEIDEVIEAHSRKEIECARPQSQADSQQRAFVAEGSSSGRFNIIWEPRMIQFANGKVLKTNDS
jgi:hypothetical protein